MKNKSMRSLALLLALITLLCVLPALAQETAQPVGVSSSAIVGAGGGTLVINEVMASNSQTIEDSFGKSSDWVELFNSGDEPFDMTNVFLSDSKKDLFRYQFPDGLMVEPGGYLLIFCSGLKKNVADELHTPFKLSAAGETIHLTKNGELLDSLSYPPQTADISYALTPEGEFQFTVTPTPGQANVITLDNGK